MAAILLAAMSIMIIAQVAFRYVLNDSLTWTEELAKFSMIWIACLVAPWAYVKHLNVAIEMFNEALPIVLQRIADICITLLVLVVSYQFFLYSLDFVVAGKTISASSVKLSLFYVYLCMPYVFGSLFLIALEKLLRQIFSSALSPHIEQDQVKELN